MTSAPYHVIPTQVVVRGREFRRTARNRAMREYFYGKEPKSLFPFSFDVAFAEIKIFKIGGNYY